MNQKAKNSEKKKERKLTCNKSREEKVDPCKGKGLASRKK
jgi:hypothetical protein